MKTSDITKFFKKNQKQILIAVGVVVAVVVVWIVVKKVRQNSEKKDKEKSEDLTGQSVTPGLNFDDFAKRIFSAWVSTFGTDENEVYSILEQLNNQADWDYLKRRYEAYWNSMPTYEQLIHTTFGLGLSGVLVSDFRREFSKKELQHCRDILEGKNITPGF